MTAQSHVFSPVTLQALTGLQGEPGGNYTVQLDPDGVGGLFTMNPGMGDVVLRFSYNNERAELTLTILKKPMLLPAAMIWAVASDVLRRAGQPRPAASKPVGGD
jgi:hypothetical protein